MTETLALPDLLRHAGAVMTERDGHPVPAHYGSAPGELAVCVRSVGLAVRSDLAVLTVAASPRALEQLVGRALGHPLAVGGASLEAGAWWCRNADGDELCIVTRRGAADRLVRALRHDVARLSHAQLTDHGGDRVVLGLVGRKTSAVLRTLGVYGPENDPRAIPPYGVHQVAGHPLSWLLQADVAAFAIVDAVSAGAVWQAIDDAGRSEGISCVGIEAIDRYVLTERAARTGITLL